MGTKNNPGNYDCYKNAHPDEPMFILLGRDPLAPILTEIWAVLKKCPNLVEHTEEFFKIQKKKLNFYEPKLVEALKCAEHMRNWEEPE